MQKSKFKDQNDGIPTYRRGGLSNSAATQWSLKFCILHFAF